jgi:CO/xanthine dehydrogenase Mo-binding subunit
VTLSRRTFLEVAAGGAVYALAFGCARKPVDRGPAVIELSPEEAAGLKGGMELDYTEWLVIHPDGTVTAHTGRMEIGQGITTVLSNVICQGLELPEDRVEVILGDTDRCPDDGPTVGSSATMKVGWGYWLACERIRQDLVRRAADRLHLRPPISSTAA